MIASSLALVISLASVVPGINAQFCAGFQNDSNSIPQLASQFSFRVEANFVEHDRTMIVHEIYDSVNNRGVLFFRRNGTGNHIIFDYDDNEIFLLSGYGPNQTCSVQSFTSAPRFLAGTFGLNVNNGSFHIGTASGFLLQIRSVPPTTFLGNATVRGMPAYRWQACFDLPNMTYTADYYYSRNTWNYAATSSDMYDTVPICVVVNGTVIEDDGVEDFYHVYSIFDYHTGPDSSHDRQFQVPSGQVCRGRIPGQSVPTVPDVFSATFQYTFNGNMPSNRVTTVREFYHLPHKLFRIDAYYDGSQGGTAGMITLVHDFNTGLEYIVNRQTSSCLTNVIGSSNVVSFDVVDEEEDSNSLLSPRELFLLQDEYNYTYEGVTTMRGVQVDSWLSVRDFESFGKNSNLTQGVVELFFTRPEYTLSSVYSNGESVVPWAVRLRGVVSYVNMTTGEIMESSVTMESDVVEFSTREPTYDAFDVSLCFPDSDVHTLVMVFDVGLTGLDLGDFRTKVRSSIRGLTGLQPLQINNIQLLRGNDTMVIVSVHLANLSSSAQLSGGQKMVSAREAFAVVNNTRPDGSLPFSIFINNTMVTPRLLRFGQGRNVTVVTPSQNCTMNNTNSCDDNITNRLKLTDAVVTGIAVGLFFGGLIIGILCTLCAVCMCKCLCGGERGSFDVKRASSSVKYKKHDDELDNIS